MTFLNENRIMLCCKAGSCPIVEKQDNGDFTITDDYSGKVLITKEQMGILKNTIEHFEKNV